MATASDTVNQMIDELIGREGGYVDHPADRGGPTRWGITEQVARAFGYKGEMRALPRDVAVSIYLQRYWSQPGFDQVAQRYPRLAVELFDTAVNMGPAVAAGFLQRALNVLNREHSDYPDIGVDSRVGRMTLAALDGLVKARGAAGEQVILRVVDSLQGARYVAIAEGRPANEAFVYGWFANRVGVEP